MATFTMRLSEVLEHVYNESADPDDYEQEYASFTFNEVTYGKLPVIPEPEKIGLGTYPIFNEAYRQILNGKIVDNYYNREIGSETIDEWLLVMRRKMDQIMPFYNKLYETELLTFDPLSTIDITTEGTNRVQGTESVTAESDNTTETESGARAVASATPQTMLAGNADYATGSTDTNSDSNVTASGTQESSSENESEATSDSRTHGYQGYATELVVRLRNSFINIDTMILTEIEDCFFLLFNTGDAYTTQGWYY